ncbi:MAG TPA: PhoU domain-containing protein [Methanoregulaceae archaeon]|nr:PhoU domain-containing protein [Methanoregulaceae archaeon]
MEIRKVQITGGSSFVITLPKEWAESMHIKKNDPLGIIVQPDGTLLITKETTDAQVPRVKRFDATGIEDPTYIFRLLIGSYISGYTTIEVFSKDRLPVSVRMAVRDFTQMTIGPEVVEETDSSIVLKDLLNPMEMPFDNTLKRMYVIVKNMYQDAMIVLETQNMELARDVISRDNDVDRLNWLIARQTNIILKNVKITRKMNSTIGKVINCYKISRIIERIGDHAVKWAENSRKIQGQKLNEGILESIRSANTLSLSILDKSIVSFFQGKLLESHKNIERVAELESLCEKINSQVKNFQPEVAVPLRYIAESIRRSGEYAGDISETVINYLVEEQ